MIVQGKLFLILVMVILAGFIGFFVYYAGLDRPEIERVEIEIEKVELLDVNSLANRIKLKVTFLVTNPSEQTYTVPVISYNLFANGQYIGKGTHSTLDIPMTGRATFYPDKSIGLPDFLEVTSTPEIAEVYNSIISGEDVVYTATGVLTVETAWSFFEIDFQTYE